MLVTGNRNTSNRQLDAYQPFQVHVVDKTFMRRLLTGTL